MYFFMVAEKNQFIKSILKYIIAQSRLQRGLGTEQQSQHNSNSSAEFPLLWNQLQCAAISAFMFME